MKFNSGRFKKGQVSPRKGQVVSAETRLKMRLAKLGTTRIFTEEHRRKLSLSAIGRKCPSLKGKKRIFTDEWKLNMSLARQNKFKDRTLLKKREDRKSQSYTDWKDSVRNRDGHECRMKNSECEEILEAHHILSWRDYPELRYDINNGILLCKYHHPRKRAEEARLSPYFRDLILENQHG